MTDDAPKPPRLRTPAGWQAWMDKQRAAAPDRFLDAPDGLGAPHLFVENVARMLGCSVDYVRRLPPAVLPRSKIGQRLIYARADVEAFIVSRRDAGTAGYVAGRKPRARAEGAGEAVPAQPFDPVSHVRKLMKGSEPK